MFNKTFIGHTFEDKVIHVEMGKLKFFSKVIGEKNPIYFNEKDDIENITLKLNAWLEKKILINPEQWIWTHNKWKL